MSTETITMLLEILKKLGCSEETINAVKADPALKSEENPEEDKKETPMDEEKEDVTVVVAKEEKPEEESPMKALMKSMLKSK